MHSTAQRVRKKKKGADTKTEIVLGEPKTKSSQREIPLFDELWKMLMEFKTKQKFRQLAAGSAYTANDLIFCNAIGGVIEPRTFEDVFNRLIAKSKIADATFHTLRHTFATRALEQNMDIHTLSKLLGHAQASTTLNMYGHCLPDHKAKSMEKMQYLFSKCGKEKEAPIFMPSIRAI